MQGFLIPYEQPHGFFTKLMNGYVVDFIDVTIPPVSYTHLDVYKRQAQYA